MADNKKTNGGDVKKFIQEFKEFAIKGNVIDMAVGVIIGGAFGKIVSSLVADVIMPLIGIVLGGTNLAGLSWTINVEGKAPVVLSYGSFLQNVLDFLIIAFCIFTDIKFVNRLTDLGKKKPEEEEVKVKAATELGTLLEIRDLLEKQTKSPKKK